MREPLVMLPSLMCDARLFSAQIAVLSADTAVMVAPITHAERIEDMAQDVLRWAPEKFALAGASMGAIVAMEVLRRAPDRVTRVALMDTTPLAETPQTAAAYEPLIVAARAGRLEEIIPEFARPEHLVATPERPAIVSLLRDMALRLGPEVFVRQARALQRRRDQQSTLRKCKVPAMVLCGEFDQATPVKRHAFMSELIPYAQLRVIKGAGYLPSLEKPAATTAALQDWMDQPFVLQ